MPGNSNVVSLATQAAVTKDSDAKRKAAQRALLARLPAPVHLLQEKSKQSLLALFKKLFDTADDALFELADQATNNQEQNLYFESMREVRIKRRNIEIYFSDAIDLAFSTLASAAVPADNYAEEFPDVSIDSLSLVQNDELEELVAADSMVAKANEMFAEKIQHLSLRLDNLVPLKVYQKNNPVGPDQVCDAFFNATKDLTVDIKAKLVLYKLFDKQVVTQLGRVYDGLNQLLVEQNILPSLQQDIRQARRSARPSRAPGHITSDHTANGYDVGGMGESAQSDDVLNVLRDLLSDQSDASGHGDSGFGSAGQGSSDQAGSLQGQGVPGDVLKSPDLMSLLSKIQHKQQSQSHVDHVEVNRVLTNLLEKQQSNKQINQVDNDVINLVNMLFEFILDDRNLASPMKALLGRLQIPILKVAIADKSFFGKGGHPARRLLNEMATSALGWQDDGKRKDVFYKKIEDIVQRLLGEFESDTDIFNELLTDFVAFIEKEQRRAAILEQRTLDAEDGKAKAERARAIVDQSLAVLCQGVELPREAQALLQEAWGNVLFLISLKHGHDGDEWAQGQETATDLIWSVTAPVNKENRQRLLRLVPNLLKRLRLGLESISYNPFEMAKLFKQLESLHLAKLKAPLEALQETPLEAPQEKPLEAPQKKPLETSGRSKSETSDNLAPVTAPEPSKIGDSSDFELSVSEQRISENKVSDQNVQETVAPETKGPEVATGTYVEPQVSKPLSGNVSPEASLVVDQGSVAELPEGDEHLLQVDKLTQGTWFEMAEDDNKPYRCRLAAIIKPVGKYIFVNRSGMKVAEKTRSGLAMALKDSSLRALDDGMLFDRALESVIGDLRKSRGVTA